MFLHDVNSLECENAEALFGARRSVALFRDLPQIVRVSQRRSLDIADGQPVSDVDSFVVVIWGMIARTLLKEMHRLRLEGDLIDAANAEGDVDIVMREINRVGESMGIA